MMTKQELARAVGASLGVTESPAWFSTESKVTADFQRAIGPLLGVETYGGNKVRHMQEILGSVGIPWVASRHSSEGAAQPGGNVRKEAYGDLLAALQSANSHPNESPSSVTGPADPEFVQRSIRLRRGQPRFRKELLEIYGGKCAVTGCSAAAVLEAAHIQPFAESGSTNPENGILLRADLHTLFDLRLIAIDSAGWNLLVHRSLKGTEYWNLRGLPIALPARMAVWPDVVAIDNHRRLSGL